MRRSLVEGNPENQEWQWGRTLVPSETGPGDPENRDCQELVVLLGKDLGSRRLRAVAPVPHANGAPPAPPTYRLR